MKAAGIKRSARVREKSVQSKLWSQFSVKYVCEKICGAHSKPNQFVFANSPPNGRSESGRSNGADPIGQCSCCRFCLQSTSDRAMEFKLHGWIAHVSNIASRGIWKWIDANLPAAWMFYKCRNRWIDLTWIWAMLIGIELINNWFFSFDVWVLSANHNSPSEQLSLLQLQPISVSATNLWLNYQSSSACCWLSDWRSSNAYTSTMWIE